MFWNEKFNIPVAESKYIVSVKAKTLNWRNLLYFGNSMALLPAKYLDELDGTAYLEEYLFKLLPGTGPYTMAWSNGGIGTSAIGLCAGIYSVTITDASGCTADTSLSIAEPAPITATLFITWILLY